MQLSAPEANALNDHIMRVFPEQESLFPYGPNTWWRFYRDVPYSIRPAYGHRDILMMQSATGGEPVGLIGYYNPYTLQFVLEAKDFPPPVNP
jgi:hypothetical protein